MNLDALARANAAERAQELYNRIAALHQEGYYAVAPDVVSFNSVLKACQKNPDAALQFWNEHQQEPPSGRGASGDVGEKSIYTHR